MRKSIVIFCMVVAAASLGKAAAPLFGDMMDALTGSQGFILQSGTATYENQSGEVVTRETNITGIIHGTDGDLFIDGIYGHAGAEVWHGKIISVTNSDGIKNALAHPTINFVTGYSMGVVIIE